jgi:hypothetical protein
MHIIVIVNIIVNVEKNDSVVIDNWNSLNRFLYYGESLLMPVNWWWSDPYWNHEYFHWTGTYSMVWWWPALNSWKYFVLNRFTGFFYRGGLHMPSLVLAIVWIVSTSEQIGERLKSFRSLNEIPISKNNY